MVTFKIKHDNACSSSHNYTLLAFKISFCFYGIGIFRVFLLLLTAGIIWKVNFFSEKQL